MWYGAQAVLLILGSDVLKDEAAQPRAISFRKSRDSSLACVSDTRLTGCVGCVNLLRLSLHATHFPRACADPSGATDDERRGIC